MSNQIPNPGKIMRERALSMAMKRKEEYLGARVPRELRDRVLQRSKDLGIPVSILIRNILEEAFKEAEAAMTSGQTVAESGGRDDRFAAVLGWEKMVLNRNVVCSGCSISLHAGQSVTLGLGAGELIVLCDKCKSRI
ncbi:MAG: hypothetical protein HY272_13415 [Gammaproteobacteria bacterium]|nr:hypothetical protein [Gammaproteobacteria bacterium]